MSALLVDIALALLALGVAGAAILGRDLFAAIALFIGYGVMLALLWLRLGAVDVAMAEAAIGAGLTGVLLIGAWAKLRGLGALDEPRTPILSRATIAALSAGVTAVLALVVVALPADNPGLAAAVDAEIGRAGVSHPVTAVLLNMRAFDTLLETIVLVGALVAVWSLTPKGAVGARPGPRQHVRPDGVLAALGRLLPPLGVVVAVYLVYAGSDRPGGAFQAGTVLAAVLVLIALAAIARPPRQTSRLLAAAIVFGPAFFLAVGLVGTVFGTFLGFAPDLAGLLIVVIEYALAASIAVGLALLVAGVPEERRP